MTINKLPLRERLAASLICGSFLLLSLFALLLPQTTLPRNQPTHTNLEVTILGAVMHPGDYELPPGAILHDLLELAQPTREADFSRMRRQRKLTHGEEIILPAKKPLTIYLDGKKIQVPKGTRICDLRLWIDLDPQTADQLASKRTLKDGDQLSTEVKRSRRRSQPESASAPAPEKP